MIKMSLSKSICLAFVCDFALRTSTVVYGQDNHQLDSFVERPWTPARHLSIPTDDIW